MSHIRFHSVDLQLHMTQIEGDTVAAGCSRCDTRSNAIQPEQRVKWA